MLTPEQVQEARNKYGITPATSEPSAPDRIAELNAAWGEEKPGLLKRVSADLKQRGENVAGAIQGTSPESKGENAVVRGLQATKELFGGVGDVAGEIVRPLQENAQKASEARDESLRAQGIEPTKPIDWAKIGHSITNLGGKALQPLVEKHPETADTLESILKGLSATGEIAGTIAGADAGASALGKIPAKQLATKGLDATSSAVEKIKGVVKKNPEATQTIAKAEELQALKDKITPKPTVKEAKLAMEEGRLVKGKEPTFFKSGTPDQVITSDQQFKSIQTIDRLIPEHASLNEPQLYTALKEKVVQTAKDLKPEMQKVKITPRTVEKINADWEKIKTEQRNSPYLPSDVNVKRLQQDFENYLQKSKSGNMDDLWETRKTYDDSVPDNVKSANALSSESLQAKKEIWLQNRRILNDAINDSENGLGKMSKDSFSDMKDMYDAQTGIKSKAEIDVSPKPSKLKEIAKPVVRAGAKAAGLGVGLHVLP